uniref:Uncharacterized protein n=1 Tax=Pyrodinium bahamense TaxID=73915 RepID=A0A7S0AX54_9DINO
MAGAGAAGGEEAGNGAPEAGREGDEDAANSGGEGSLALGTLGLLALVRGLLAVWAGEQEGLRGPRLFQRARRIAVQRASALKVEPMNQARLVHVHGTTATDETDVLRDPIFGIEVRNTLKLRRKVEMFQWSEHAETVLRELPGGVKEQVRTYSYRAGWHPAPVESWKFQGHQGRRHSNPGMTFAGYEWQAQQATLGNFKLPGQLVGQVSNYVPCTDLAPTETDLSEAYGGQAFKQALVEGTMYLVSRSPTEPHEIGDVRVSFERVPCEEATVLAVQEKDGFKALRAADRIDGNGRVCSEEEDPCMGGSSCLGCLCCLPSDQASAAEDEEVFIIMPGKKSARQMLLAAESSQRRQRRWPNLIGLLCIVVGLGLLGSVAPVLFQAIPYVGAWIEPIGAPAIWATALILGLVLGYAVAELAWLQVRPCRALLLLLAATAAGLAPWLYRYAAAPI